MAGLDGMYRMISMRQILESGSFAIMSNFSDGKMAKWVLHINSEP